MRYLNPPYQPFYDFSHNFRRRVMVYQRGDSVTEDPALADVDQFGLPIRMPEKCTKSVVIDVFDTLPTMPCYDTEDLASLSAARLARQSFAGNASAVSVPTTYIDKFDAYQFATKSANALVDAVETLQRQESLQATEREEKS